MAASQLWSNLLTDKSKQFINTGDDGLHNYIHYSDSGKKLWYTWDDVCDVYNKTNQIK